MTQRFVGGIGSKAEDAPLLAQELDAALSEGLCAVAIVDPASYASAWSEFGGLAKSRVGASLFAGTSHPENIAVAPLILPLQHGDVELHAELARIASAFPAVLWLASPLPLPVLKNTLAVKLHAQLADGRDITLRYQDPRVLPELLRVLDDEQATRFHHGVTAWWWFDRDNLLCCSRQELPMPAASSAAPWSPAIVLTDDQVDALLAASFIDRVLDVLQRARPSAWQGWQRAPRHRAASALVEEAAKWRLTSEFDCASYIAVALQEGPDFADAPEWVTDMTRVKAGMLSFSDAIVGWEARRAESFGRET